MTEQEEIEALRELVKRQAQQLEQMAELVYEVGVGNLTAEIRIRYSGGVPDPCTVGGI